MYFVTSVFYEITFITSNTDKPDTDSNVGLCVHIYHDTLLVQIFRAKKKSTKYRQFFISLTSIGLTSRSCVIL